jgi:hypothetical protein
MLGYFDDASRIDSEEGIHCGNFRRQKSSRKISTLSAYDNEAKSHSITISCTSLRSCVPNRLLPRTVEGPATPSATLEGLILVLDVPASVVDVVAIVAVVVPVLLFSALPLLVCSEVELPLSYGNTASPDVA